MTETTFCLKGCIINGKNITGIMKPVAPRSLKIKKWTKKIINSFEFIFFYCFDVMIGVFHANLYCKVASQQRQRYYNNMRLPIDARSLKIQKCAKEIINSFEFKSFCCFDLISRRFLRQFVL